ncbi:266_t:CDS:2 [Entrophospora sp. SA101]|nr:266_t:CDS:2 [Entrophospora sp. SA101]
MSSRQMEHAILIEVIEKIIPVLETKNNKWKLFEQPIMSYYNKCVYAAILYSSKDKTKVPTDDDLFHMQTQNQSKKAVNHIKLNYTDKKTDYPKSFPAQHVLAILHNNHGVEYLLKVACEAGEIFRTGHYQYYTFIQQQRNRKRSQNVAVITERNEACIKKVMDKKENLKSFDFSKDLVPYGHIMQEEMKNTKFRLSFSFLIYNFDSLVKCQGCHSFPNGSLKMDFDMDTLTVILTGGGKTLICAASALLFKGLTVVFTPLKSLMEDQLMELVKMEVPSATLLASSDQPPHVHEKIFMEIASEFY